MQVNTLKFFEDVDHGLIVRVNPSSGYDVLEVFKDGRWKKCEMDSIYAREYWLGEGNCCLFEIDEATAIMKISKQSKK